MKAELRSLIGKPNFGKFDNTFAFEEYDIPVAIREIRQTAPTWYFFMFDILRNVRNDQDHHPVSLKQENEAIPKKNSSCLQRWHVIRGFASDQMFSYVARARR